METTSIGNSAKMDKGNGHLVFEMMGRQFQLVDNGLNPQEVREFIETMAGSSENILERLKHYTSLQKLSVSLQNMEEETQQVVVNIKNQAKLEAEKEKKAIIEDANRKAEAILVENRQIVTGIRQKAKQEAEAEKSQIIKEANDKADNILDETRQLTDTLKRQVKQDGEQEKKRIIEESQHTAGEMLEKARQECTEYFENTKLALEETQSNAASILKKYQAAIEYIKSVLDDSTANAELLESVLIDGKSMTQLESSQLFIPRRPEKETESKKSTGDSAGSDESVVNSQIVENETSGVVHGREQYTPLFTVESPVNEEKNEPAEETVAGSPINKPLKNSHREYTGNLALVIGQGEDPTRLEALLNEVENLPGVHLLLHGGSVDGPTTAKLILDKPIDLITELLKISFVSHVEEELVEPAKPSRLGRVFGNRNTKQPVEQEPRLVISLTEGVAASAD